MNTSEVFFTKFERMFRKNISIQTAHNYEHSQLLLNAMGRGKYSKGLRNMNRRAEQGKGLSCSFGAKGNNFDHEKGHRITKQQVKKLIAERHMSNIGGQLPCVAGKPARKSKGDLVIMK